MLSRFALLALVGIQATESCETTQPPPPETGGAAGATSGGAAGTSGSGGSGGSISAGAGGSSSGSSGASGSSASTGGSSGSTGGAAGTSGTSGGQGGSSGGASTGRFRVQGTQIIDPDGKPFVVRGVNINGYNWVWPGDMIPDADKITNCWRFNLVRVPSRLYPEPGSPVWTDNNDLDRLIETFTSRKVVVMFDAHDRIGQYYTGSDLDGLVEFYRDLATKHKNNAYVWFDLVNEPGNTSPDRNLWLNQYRSVIRAVRDDVGADNLIMVEGTAWGQDAGSWSSSNVATSKSAILQWANEVKTFDGKTYPNIAVSIHVYDQWTYGDARMADYFDRVAAAGHALVIGEYGVENAGNDTSAATQSLFNVAVPRGVGRIVWAWWGGDDNELTTSDNGGGQHINSCTNPTNLSWLGRKVWDDNH